MPLIFVNDVGYLFYGLQYFDQCPPENLEAKILLRSYLNLIPNKIAPAFADYLTLIILGEARHAPYQIHNKLIKYKNCNIGKGEGRSIVYAEASKFSQSSIVKTCLDVFDTKIYHWHSGYGGESWHKITEILVQYLGKETTPIQFIDKCFYIAHNGNRLFDKDVIFYSDEYMLRRMLDRKNGGSLNDDSLDDEFRSLGLFGFLNCEHIKASIAQMTNYIPIIWGDIDIKYSVHERKEEYGEEEEMEEENDGDSNDGLSICVEGQLPQAKVCSSR